MFRNYRLLMDEVYPCPKSSLNFPAVPFQVKDVHQRSNIYSHTAKGKQSLFLRVMSYGNPTISLMPLLLKLLCLSRNCELCVPFGANCLIRLHSCPQRPDLNEATLSKCHSPHDSWEEKIMPEQRQYNTWDQTSPNTVLCNIQLMLTVGVQKGIKRCAVVGK